MSGILFPIIADADNTDDAEKIVLVGSVLLIAGITCISVGVPIRIVGVSKRNGAVRNYCQQQYSAMSYAPRFQINLYSNRVGFAYVF